MSVRMDRMLDDLRLIRLQSSVQSRRTLLDASV